MDRGESTRPSWNDMGNNELMPPKVKERFIGLQGCAKACRQDGLSAEEIARRAIRLYDLLLANALEPTLMPREDTLEYQEPMTKDQREGVGKFVQANKLDARFEKWLGGLFPEVNQGGVGRLTSEHAARILKNPVKCLESFAKFTGADTGADKRGKNGQT